MNRRELMTIELKEALGSALLDLMKVKPLDKITVDEFSEKANVGRVTYYRHFHSKQEAISYKLSRDWMHYEEEHNLDSEEMPPLEYAAAFFTYLYSIRDINKLLIEAGCKSCILDAMRYSFRNISDKTNAHEYYRDYFRSNGLFGVVEGWIKADYDLTVIEISKLAVEFFYRI